MMPLIPNNATQANSTINVSVPVPSAVVQKAKEEQPQPKQQPAQDNFKRAQVIPHSIILPYFEESAQQYKRHVIKYSIKKKKRKKDLLVKWLHVKNTIITNPGLVQYEKTRAPEGSGLISRGIYYGPGQFLPDLENNTNPVGSGNVAANPPIQNNPAAGVEKDSKKLKEQLRKLLTLHKKRIKYKASNENTSKVDSGVVPLVEHPNQLAPKGSDRLRTNAGSSKNFVDTSAKKFYKIPSAGNEPQLHSEHAANQAMRELGVTNVLPSSVEEHHGQNYLSFPLLHPEEHGNIFNTYRDSVNNDANIPSSQLMRHGLASWLIHAADRHAGNYLVNKHTKQLHAIDFGEAWHPALSLKDDEGNIANRNVHPEDDALLHLKHVNVDGTSALNLPIPRHIVDEFLDKKPKIEQHLEEGIKDLPQESHKQEARALLSEKFDILKKLQGKLAQGQKIALRHLPVYSGITKNTNGPL